MLAVENIKKSYKNKYVLKDISITFGDGIYGLLGENGAGKTTFLSVLTGLLVPDSGIVTYDGVAIHHKQSNYREKLGYMPQYATYYPNFTADEFMRYMCILKGVEKKKQASLISELLNKVNLYDARNDKIGTFSGGMKQRLGIAQAIINNPQVLILDEPTAGLDPRERIRFRDLILELAANRTILLATHIVPDIEQIANQVIILHSGKIVAMGSKENLLNELQSNILNLEDLFLYYT